LQIVGKLNPALDQGKLPTKTPGVTSWGNVETNEETTKK